MQIILQLRESATEYSSQRKQMQLRPPLKCSHCGHEKTLRALGYYSRNVSGEKGRILCIGIRRFRCFQCRKTVSLLPSFAQPYRLILNDTIESGIAGNLFKADVEPWRHLIRQYWRRFCSSVPCLSGEMERAAGFAFPPGNPERSWSMMLHWGGSLSLTTLKLTQLARLTPFGRYRCHSPFGGKVHTPYLFPS